MQGWEVKGSIAALKVVLVSVPRKKGVRCAGGEMHQDYLIIWECELSHKPPLPLQLVNLCFRAACSSGVGSGGGGAGKPFGNKVLLLSLTIFKINAGDRYV